MCVLFYSSFVCLYVYTYDFKSKVHCGSALGPGASRLPYYCTPLVCVPAVLGGSAGDDKTTKPKQTYQNKTKTLPARVKYIRWSSMTKVCQWGNTLVIQRFRKNIQRVSVPVRSFFTHFPTYPTLSIFSAKPRRWCWNPAEKIERTGRSGLTNE